MTTRRRLRVFLTVALAAGGVATAAYAAFTDATGQGAGSAISGSMLPVQVAALSGGDTPSTELQPGGTGTVILRVTNPNATSVMIVSVIGNGPITVSGASGSCVSSAVTFTDQTGLAISVPASSNTLVSLSGAASMGVTSPSGCQGASFNIPVDVTTELP